MSPGRHARAAAPAAIRLVVSDIDGTLVTPDKQVTPRAMAAVKALAAAGVGFSVVSARPPRGMAAIVSRLGLRQPYAAFNGGNLMGADGRLIAAERLTAEAARIILRRLAESKVDAWVFAGDSWRLTHSDGPQVGRERATVGFEPVVVADFEDVVDHIDKIVGVSDDAAQLLALEAGAAGWLGGGALVQRSQAYYLDFTAPRADKGHAVRAICEHAGVAPEETAVIGDMSNDVAMFEVVGFSIAMGQAPDAVKARADAVTEANSAEGFAHAVERLVLPRVRHP
jgi:Cof subfamily protein (haloacid dehalogenase superfamily)